jgi:hypothetical protein
VVAELPAEPQLPSGAELLTGEFEYVAAHHGTEIRRAVRIADGLMTRLVDGRVTSEAPYTIVETRPGRVTVEISETGRPPARRSFEFSDADHMVDVVTPELLFARVEDPTTTTTAPSEGSASD